MIRIAAALACLLLGAVAARTEEVPAGSQTRPAAVTSLWRDTLADTTRVRLDQVPDITEPSDLLLIGDDLYTVSDDYTRIYRIGFDGPHGSPKSNGSWVISGIPPGADLEALAELPRGQVLVASETHGTIFVVNPFPGHACAAWSTGIEGTCFIGRANCGIEAMAVLPGKRLFVAKEREPRAAYIFDLPDDPCSAGKLTGRIYLKLPEEVGPDISAATYDPVSKHLFLVARARQAVLEFEVPEPTPGDTSPRPLVLLGEFSFAASENALDYPGLDFHQVEGIAIDAKRVLYLIVDNNSRFSRAFGNNRAAMLRFFPVP